MILTLHTETVIDSAHQLKGYKGICSRVHGHSWLVELWFRGSNQYLDEVGILVDFGIVKELKEVLDHKFLNDVVDVNPTAENLSVWVYDWLHNRINDENQKLKQRVEIKVRLYETVVGKKTYCECGDFK